MNKYKALPGKVVVRQLSKSGLRSHQRGEILSVGKGCDPALKTGVVIVYNGALSTRCDDGLFVVDANFKGAIALIDNRKVAETHLCIFGTEQPGREVDCKAHKAFSEYNAIAAKAHVAEKGTPQAKRDMTPAVMEAYQLGELTPIEMRDTYGVPIDEI